MGGGLSASPPSEAPQDVFGFEVAKAEYHRISTLSSENGIEIDETELHERLKAIYSKALQEFENPLEDCRCPAVILLKYSRLTEEEKKEFNDAVVGAIIEKEKIRKKAIDNTKAVDYSQSFGGTADDTKNEKEAAALLRGHEGVAEEEVPILRKPDCLSKFDIENLRKAGVWKRFMGAQCFMFIHTLTKDIEGVRPSDYIDEESDASKTSSDECFKDPANGLPSIELSELPAVLERIITDEKMTPLILDPLDVGARAFFSYKGRLEDVSSLTIPFAKSGVKRSDVVENCRKTLVGAIKSGTTFALYLGGCTIEHADWKKKLCKKDTFPADTFTNAGAKLLQPANEPRFKAIFREADLESGVATYRDGFRVVVISSLDPHVYEAQLEDSIPLGYMQAIYIRKSA